MAHQVNSFVYLCVDGRARIVEARVLDYLKRLYDEGEGPGFSLFLFARRKNEYRRHFDRSEKSRIEKEIGGCLVARQFSNRLVGLIGALCLMVRHLFPRCLKGRTIIHARTNNAAVIGAAFKWLCVGRPYLIYDVRGDTCGELDFKWKKAGYGSDNWRVKVSFACTMTREWFALRSANAMFCHTIVLRRVLQRRFKFVRNLPGLITPSHADEHLFYYDPERGGKLRSQLGLTSDDRVLVHAGGVEQYHGLKDMVKLFKLILESDARYKFIVSVPEGEKESAREALESLPCESYRLCSVTHEQVPGLLNAADLGLLVLESHPANRTRSPVRFAEYICCGLPVAISPRIGDASRLTVKRNLGGIVSAGSYTTAAEGIKSLTERYRGDESRRRIASIARETVALSAYIKTHRCWYNQVYDVAK